MPISEKQCVYDGELNREESMPTSFLFRRGMVIIIKMEFSEKSNVQS